MARHIVSGGTVTEAKAERLYAVEDKNGEHAYAWSPDGEGFWWYDTMDEVNDQLGEDASRVIYVVDEITDF